MPTRELVQAVAVTAELCGREFSPAAAAMFVGDLARFPEHQVIGALTRCRREVRGMLTLADVISRLDDGRPGAEEAWAMIPRDEAGSVVWSAEIASAFGVCRRLLDEGDVIAARMTFKEAYAAECGRARDAGTPVSWTPSLGHSKGGRDGALQEAVRKGRITLEHAQDLAPELEAPKGDAIKVLQMAAGAAQRIGA